MDPSPIVHVSPLAAGILTFGSLGTVFAWKLLPSRKHDWATDMALVKNELRHLRDDVSEIKTELKNVQSKLR